MGERGVGRVPRRSPHSQGDGCTHLRLRRLSCAERRYLAGEGRVGGGVHHGQLPAHALLWPECVCARAGARARLRVAWRCRYGLRRRVTPDRTRAFAKQTKTAPPSVWCLTSTQPASKTRACGTTATPRGAA